MDQPIPLIDLKEQYAALRGEIEPVVLEVMATQAMVLGPRVESFERAICAFTGAPHAVGASSGTDAQLMLLMALGIGGGDAVAIPAFTFFSTAGSVVRAGAEPVFCDIDPATFNIDAVKLEELLAGCARHGVAGELRTAAGNRLRAIVPVHLFGQCADMAAIGKLARRYDLVVIEDAAQALGTEWPAADGLNMRAGTIGAAGFYSFYPTKNLGAFGDGGLAVCQDADVADQLRAVRNHGMTQRYHHRTVGGNFRLDALQAAVLEIKLRHLDEWSAKRRRNAEAYRSMFAGAGPEPDDLQPPVERWSGLGCENGHIYNQFTVRVGGGRRDALREHLGARGIGTEIYYPVPLHLQECFAGLGYAEGSFPEAERAAREVLSLPVYPELRMEQLERVSAAVCAFFQ